MKTIRHRRGIASLEMVIFLPPLILLALILFFICGFGIQTSETIVEARHESWSKRYGDKENRDWYTPPFLLGGDENQYAKGKSERKVKLVKLFDQWAKPKSEHLVLAGTWDHEEDLLGSSPNLKTAFRVAGMYARSIYASAKGDYDTLRTELKKLGDPRKLVKEAAGKLVDEFSKQKLNPSNLSPF